MPRRSETFNSYFPENDILSIMYFPNSEKTRSGLEIVRDIILGVDYLGNIYDVFIKNALRNLAPFGHFETDSFKLNPNLRFSRLLAQHPVEAIIANAAGNNTRHFLVKKIFVSHG